MTTNTWNTPIAHTNNTTFRAWIAELSGKLESYGFPKTADTGQINTGTANRPSAGSYAGYEIRYLNDALHGTAPIYMKIEYGTSAGGSTIPSIRIQLGKGSNGSGTITDELMPATVLSMEFAPSSTTANYPSYLCSKDGYFALAWKVRSNSSGLGIGMWWALCRWCDSSGTPLGTGFDFVHAYYLGQCNYYTVEYATPVTSSQRVGCNCFVPGLASESSLVSGGPQVLRHFTKQPAVQVNPFLIGLVPNEIGDQATFTATPVGVASRTYLSLSMGSFTAAPYYCSWGGVASSDHALHIAMQYD